MHERVVAIGEALEQTVEPPYRAEAVRQPEEIWSVFSAEYLTREAPLRLNSVHTSSATLCEVETRSTTIRSRMFSAIAT